MIGENLELEKALITETNLQQNQTDHDYQLWQVVSKTCASLLTTTYRDLAKLPFLIFE